MVAAQIEAVITDIGADAVKTGMLASTEIIETVARELAHFRVDRLVVDPVMVAKSGDRLLREDAIDVMRRSLLPLAAVVTPNIPEAEALADMEISSPEDARQAAVKIANMGAKAVVVKGGPPEGRPGGPALRRPRFPGAHRAPHRHEEHPRHGCTFASAIAAGLAKGMELPDAVVAAKEYVTEALRRSFSVGQGHGPLNHFYRLE